MQWKTVIDMRAKWWRGFWKKRNLSRSVRKRWFRLCTSPGRSIAHAIWRRTMRGAPRLASMAEPIPSIIARSPRCLTLFSNAKISRARFHAAVQTGLSRTLRPESRSARFSFAEVPPDPRNAAPRKHSCGARIPAPGSCERRRHLASPHSGLGAQTENRHAYRQRRDETRGAVFARTGGSGVARGGRLDSRGAVGVARRVWFEPGRRISSRVSGARGRLLRDSRRGGGDSKAAGGWRSKKSHGR